MNDNPANFSLAQRARRLTALARATRDDRDASQAQGQVQTALNKLDQELANLKGVLGIHRKLKAIGAPVADPGDLKRSAVRLKEQAELGRPTAQFLSARVRDVTETRAAIDNANVDVWRRWAAERLGELPLALLPKVHFSRRNATTSRVAEMRAIAGRKPAIADIVQFQLVYERVRAELDALESDGVGALLDRFTDGRILLADLTDAELEMLREDASLSDQLYLHISP